MKTPFVPAVLIAALGASPLDAESPTRVNHGTVPYARIEQEIISTPYAHILGEQKSHEVLSLKLREQEQRDACVRLPEHYRSVASLIGATPTEPVVESGSLEILAGSDVLGDLDEESLQQGRFFRFGFPSKHFPRGAKRWIMAFDLNNNKIIEYRRNGDGPTDWIAVSLVHGVKSETAYGLISAFYTDFRKCQEGKNIALYDPLKHETVLPVLR